MFTPEEEKYLKDLCAVHFKEVEARDKMAELENYRRTVLSEGKSVAEMKVLTQPLIDQYLALEAEVKQLKTI